MITNSSLTPEDWILRAKIQLQRNNPFFGYLAFMLKYVQEDDPKKCPTMCITNQDEIHWGVHFVKHLVEKHSGNGSDAVDKIIQTILCHEILHKILLHIPRGYIFLNKLPNKEQRAVDMQLANIAEDVCVNHILSLNDQKFKMDDGCIVVENEQTTIKFRNSRGGVKEVVIKDAGTKSWEQIYWEIEKYRENIPEDYQGDIDFDSAAKDENGKPSDPAKAGELSDKWKNFVAQAAATAKRRGITPGGLDRLIGSILEPKVPWTAVLRKYVTSELIYDMTYARPNRRSRATGVYMPSPLKENVVLICHVDTSGSCYDRTPEFFSEIMSMLHSFQNITIHFIQCDAAITDIRTLKRSDIYNEDWLKQKGGGGTSHKPVVDWICNQKNPAIRLFVSLTDGYSDIEECYKKLPHHINPLIVLPKEDRGMADKLEQYASVVIMED